MTISLDTDDYIPFEEINEAPVQEKETLESRYLTQDEIKTLPIEELLERLFSDSVIVSARGRKVVSLSLRLREKDYDVLVDRQANLTNDNKWMYFQVAKAATEILGGFQLECCGLDKDRLSALSKGGATLFDSGTSVMRNINEGYKIPVNSAASITSSMITDNSRLNQALDGSVDKAKSNLDKLIDSVNQAILAIIRS